jgi:hypothetical protein
LAGVASGAGAEAVSFGGGAEPLQALADSTAQDTATRLRAARAAGPDPATRRAEWKDRVRIMVVGSLVIAVASRREAPVRGSFAWNGRNT